MALRRLAGYAALALISIALMASLAGAQGCAMCYQNAAASGAKGQEALRHGILILLAPSLGLFGGILFAIFRRERSASRSEGREVAAMTKV